MLLFFQLAIVRFAKLTIESMAVLVALTIVHDDHLQLSLASAEIELSQWSKHSYQTL